MMNAAHYKRLLFEKDLRRATRKKVGMLHHTVFISNIHFRYYFSSEGWGEGGGVLVVGRFAILRMSVRLSVCLSVCFSVCGCVGGSIRHKFIFCLSVCWPAVPL